MVKCWFIVLPVLKHILDDWPTLDQLSWCS